MERIRTLSDPIGGDKASQRSTTGFFVGPNSLITRQKYIHPDSYRNLGFLLECCYEEIARVLDNPHAKADIHYILPPSTVSSQWVDRDLFYKRVIKNRSYWFRNLTKIYTSSGLKRFKTGLSLLERKMLFEGSFIRDSQIVTSPLEEMIKDPKP